MSTQPFDLDLAFQRQLELENGYMSHGYKKVIQNDHRNKERHYGSHSCVGNLIRRELVGYLASYLKSLYQDIESGKASVGSATIYELLAPHQVRFPQISHVGLSALLDNIFYPTGSASDIHKMIGQKIEDHLKLLYFKEGDDDLFDYCLKHYMRASAGYRQKMTSTGLAFSRKFDEVSKETGVEATHLKWRKWSPQQCRMLGSWIASASDQIFLYLTGMRFLDTRPISIGGKRAKPTYCLHDDIVELEANTQIQAGLNANYKDNPMVCPPVPWLPKHPGGFLTNAATSRYNLIRNRGTTEPSELALRALNNLQSTPWKVNTFVLEQLEYFFRRGESVNESDSFRPFQQPDDNDLPRLPPHLVDLQAIDDATDVHEKEKLTHLHKELKEEKKKLRAFYNKLADRRREGRIYQQVVSAAKNFANEERFWIPWSFDFRTRMYPISILNPQSGNYVNGLMQFADGYRFRDEEGTITDPSTRFWLAVHVATTKGFSKETFKGREAWVEAHEKEITLVATDPLGEGRRFWTEEADEPWTYLASCKEWYDCFIACTKDETYLPCGLDATASGLQILGALMGDESTCQLVNVLPTKKPSDLYQAIIDKTITFAKRARGKLKIPYELFSRKIAKAPTMTLAYGSTPWRRKHQVKEACNSKRGLDLGLSWDQIGYVAEKLDDAIAFVLPGVTFTLNWLQETAVVAMKEAPPEKTMIQWKTPSGCLIHQRYFVSTLKKIKTIALGMSRYRQESVVEQSDEPNLSKIESSTAANFVHSLDASILQIASETFEGPFSLTHDCVYARAGKDLVELTRRVKESFVEVVSSDVLCNFATYNGVPDQNIKLDGKINVDFDYERILKSEFIFC